MNNQTRTMQMGRQIDALSAELALLKKIVAGIIKDVRERTGDAKKTDTAPSSAQITMTDVERRIDAAIQTVRSDFESFVARDRILMEANILEKAEQTASRVALREKRYEPPPWSVIKDPIVPPPSSSSSVNKSGATLAPSMAGATLVATVAPEAAPPATETKTKVSRPRRPKKKEELNLDKTPLEDPEREQTI